MDNNLRKFQHSASASIFGQRQNIFSVLISIDKTSESFQDIGALYERPLFQIIFFSNLHMPFVWKKFVFLKETFFKFYLRDKGI